MPGRSTWLALMLCGVVTYEPSHALAHTPMTLKLRSGTHLSSHEAALDDGVGIVGHHETWGDVAGYERQMPAALDMYAALGVRVLKSGYVADAPGLRRVDSNGVDADWRSNPYAMTIESRDVVRGSFVELPLAPGGGAAIRFEALHEGNKR